MKLLIDESGKKRIFLDKTSKDLHTQYGVLKKEVFNKTRHGVVESHSGKKFLITKPNFKDLFDNLRRGPQIITLKDAGFISSQLGVSQGSKVLDCGGGSGAMTCYFANMVGPKGSVVCVEKEKRFVELVKKNVNMMGFKNVKIIHSDITKGLSMKGFDAVNLDMPSPENALMILIKVLKMGGMLSVYVPNTTQVTSFLKEVEKHESLRLLSVNELIRRRWRTGKDIMRPANNTIHTGFIMVMRRVK